jgi:hypothetical protein
MRATFTCVLLFFFQFVCPSAYGQLEIDRDVYLHTGTISPGSPLWGSHARSKVNSALPNAANPMLAIMKFDRHIDENERRHLAERGVHLQSYIPNYAWVVVIDLPLETSALKSHGFLGLLEFTAEIKTEPSLWKGHLPPSASNVEGMADLWIRYPRYFSGDSVKYWLAKEEVTVLSDALSSFQILAIRIPTENIRDLGELPFVEYIQAQPAPDESENNIGTILSRGNVLRSSSSPLGALSGRGVVIGVGDDSDPLRHPDFSGRLISRFTQIDGSGHGLHTMGIAAGAGVIREEFAGYAPKSKILSQYYSNILVNSSSYYSDFDMRVTNNSYGNSGSTDAAYRRYDLYSELVDRISVDMPDMLNVFAAGNSGNVVVPGTPFTAATSGEVGFGTVLAGYQSAKNTLVVGNINSSYRRSAGSSRGPVSNGRVKPEVVALGASVRSAYNNNSYAGLSGTSQASPAVAGGAALLIEQFRRAFPSAGYPSSALIKALICNGATDLGNSGPDYSYGYGAMNLKRSSEMLSNGQYISGSISIGTQTSSIIVPPNTAALKVMLYWTDAPGNPLSSKALINDLDLSVAHGGNQYLPFVNNGEPAAVTSEATRNVDRNNNLEQIVITNPLPGTATISVRGFSVPVGPQKYVVVYDFVPAGTSLTAPSGGEKYLPGDQLPIHWDSFGSETTFHLEYSNGGNWTRIVSDLASDRRSYTWTLPGGLSSTRLKIRVIRTIDGQISTGSEFTVLGRPTVSLAPLNLQCEGTIAINWTSVAGATRYEILKLEDDEMVVVASVGSEVTSYSITGLSRDTTYWVSVRTVLSENPGLRGIAISRKPNSGTCEGATSNGDFSIVQVTSPARSGRLLTSSALQLLHPISFSIKNLDNATSSSKQAVISYSINGGGAITQTVTLPAMPSHAEHNLTFTVPASLALVGEYSIQIKMVVEGDPISANNQITHVVSQLPNDLILLTTLAGITQSTDNFESMAAIEYVGNQVGLEGASRFDFESSQKGGRIRSFLGSGIAKSGSKALTLDTYGYPYTYTENYLTATYNLLGFGTTDEIRFDFWYMQHGQVNPDIAKVWVRGNDTAPWIEVFDLFANQAEPGVYKKSASIELSDILRAAGQSYSTSTQVKWGQSGSYQSASPQTISGYTFDDIRLYRAVSDVQITTLNSPLTAGCNFGSQETVNVSVYNSMNSSMSNVRVSYQVNGGTSVTETIPSIPAGATVQYSFSRKANLSAFQRYTIRAWVTLTGDNTPDNNEITNVVTNSPTISSFPYLQNFEGGEGSWYASGLSPSWEYGTPSATKTNRAASGTRAWKTRLKGNYNDREYSYLNSPCFAIHSLSNPSLSFMMAMDIEDCGDAASCDLAWVEFSHNGTDWQRLGNVSEGTNWYNKSYQNQQGWARSNYTRWHVASIDLPKPPNPSMTIRLRFVMRSDAFRNQEGIAIDDIHIYDKVLQPANDFQSIAEVSQNIPIANNSWTNFTSGNTIIASLSPGSGVAPGNTTVKTYASAGGISHANSSYYHPRNFVIQPTHTPLNASTKVRLYISDVETEAMVSANNCQGCQNISSVLGLGVSRFSHTDKSLENGTIYDNSSGTWDFIPPASVSKVPFGPGYYLEFNTSGFSEFWLSPASIFNGLALPVKLHQFTATLQELRQVALAWEVSEIANFSHFEIQRARGNESLKNGFFETIASVPIESEEDSHFEYIDSETIRGVRYYRLKMVDRDGSFTYSDIRSIVIATESREFLYPNPSSDGLYYLSYQTSGVVSYIVSDLIGTRLFSEELKGDGFPGKRVVDMSHFPGGTYLIEITADGKKSIHKVVKK